MKIGSIKKISLCFVLLLSKWMYAQQIEEIKKKYPNEYAVILSQKKEMRFVFDNDKPIAKSKTELEILILDEKANGMYNKYKLYHGSFKTIKNIEAYTKTMLPDGSTKKIKVTEFKTENSTSQSVFYDDVKEIAFDFPSLTKGSKAYLSYEETENEIHLLGKYFFVTYMPILFQEFKVIYPSSMDINFIKKNFTNQQITEQATESGRSKTQIFTAYDLQYKKTKGNAPDPLYYEPHVVVRVDKYVNKNDEKISCMSNVNDLYQWNYNYIKQLNVQVNDSLKQFTDSLVKGLSSETERVKKIYQWVQNNIKYVAFEDSLEGFIPRQASLVFARRFGDCKDMTSLLTYMLKLANTKAYYAWIGTRDIPYSHQELCMPGVENHMISVAQVNGQWIFLDGTCSSCIFGFPSGFIQGKEAMVSISSTEYLLLKVPEVPYTDNSVVDSTFIQIDFSQNNTLIGSSNMYFKGYIGANLMSNLLYKDASDIKDFVKERAAKGSNKYNLTSYNIIKDEQNKTVQFNTQFVLPDHVKIAGNEIYLNLILDKLFASSSIIDSNMHKVDLEFGYKYQSTYHSILQIPKGYQVEELPENYSQENEYLGVKIEFKKWNDKVVCTQYVAQKTLILPFKDFESYNAIERGALQAYKNQIVLKKM